eukprot:5452653-Pyramimonas_sp.AAC.1
MRGLLPPTPSGTPPGGRSPSRRSACPIAWRGRATSRKGKPGVGHGPKAKGGKWIQSDCKCTQKLVYSLTVNDISRPLYS